MKGILILAILLVALNSLSLTNQHQEQIFAHQDTLITQPEQPPTTNTSTSTTTAQSNTQVSTQTQPASVKNVTQSNVPLSPSNNSLNSVSPAVNPSLSQIKSKDTISKGNKVQNKKIKGGNIPKRDRAGKQSQKTTDPVAQPPVKKPTGPFFSNQLTLTFDTAVRQQTCFYSAHLQVYWNGQKIQQIIPKDYDVHSLSFKLVAKPGKNILAFAGAGISDGRGATLSNVKLIRKSSFGLQDLVENGDFKQGNSNKWSSHIYKGSYPGWKGKQIQIGRGDFYNKNWNSDITVTELDATQNTRIEQTFFFLDNYQVFYELDPRDLAA